MAIELLVRAITTPQHSGIARRHFWSQGEIVVVKQSPATWGRLEDPDTNPNNDFWIITIEGIDLDDPRVQAFLEQGVVDPGVVTPDPNQVSRFSRRRRWIDVSRLPNQVRNALNSTGRFTVRASRIGDIDTALTERTFERTSD